MTDYKDISSYEELLDLEHGKEGSESREEYNHRAHMFVVSGMLKAARTEADITQEELAARIGTNKSYISKIENGKGNIQYSTLVRIFEQGLNRKIGLIFL